MDTDFLVSLEIYLHWLFEDQVVLFSFFLALAHIPNETFIEQSKQNKGNNLHLGLFVFYIHITRGPFYGTVY